jgi:hypothetical protein
MYIKAEGGGELTGKRYVQLFPFAHVDFFSEGIFGGA